MYHDNDFAIIIPMANEEKMFLAFTNELKKILDRLESGTVYLVIDHVSKDNTLQLSNHLSETDSRFKTIWAPENKNVVDAYLRGYKEALLNNHDLIIEMDAGLSHDPRAIPMFLRTLNEGNECVYGSRFINGGSIWQSTWKRWFFSKSGTLLANILLGSSMYDMTSGYQGFHANIVEEFLNYPMISKSHFYQTELRYLLRKKRYREVPIHYRAPSQSVSSKSIGNSLSTLLHYFIRRITFNSACIYNKDSIL
jgi:dolichol-phosphate mannosyltransferase